MSLYNEIKCPKCGSYNYKKLESGVAFNYYRCKRCEHMWYQQKDWRGEGKAEETNGDNFPLLPDYSKISKLRRERKDLVEEIFKRGYGKITRDEIIDMAIELGLYNQRCKKKKRRKKK